MKREILAGVLAAPLCSGGQASAEKINIKGNSKGTAVAGEYVDSSGDPRKSTPKQVEGQQKYVKKYDGAVVLEADYTIVFKADKTVASTKSSILVDTKSFTDGGQVVKWPFTTSSIKIIDVTLKGNDTSMIESFKFEGTDWYDPKSGSFNAIINKSISGVIDLKNGTTSYEASYIYKVNATLNTIKVTGTIVPPAPGPDPDVPLDTAMQNIYSPTAVPEPATWLAVVVGLGAVAGLRRRKRAALSPSQERRCARLRPD